MAERLSLIRPHLDQRAWRLLLGAEAKVLGRGGIKTVAAATGAHPDTVAQGARELDYPEPIPGRIRRPGAGRPGATVTDPELLGALDAMVDPVTRGDPESALRWTTKSTTKLAAELTAQGHKVSPTTVANGPSRSLALRSPARTGRTRSSRSSSTTCARIPRTPARR